MKNLRTVLGIAAGLAMAAPPALAIEPTLDFGVVDEPSYQAFRGAVWAAEHVRYDYVAARRPRVVGTSTALVAFATRNPLASAAQLEAFANLYDQRLGAFAPGDPDLTRPSHFLPAARFSTPIAGETGPDADLLVGTDTDVGANVLDLLGLDVPAPDNFEAMRQRMTRFERALTVSLANAPEWAAVLVVGFSGQDLSGADNPHLAGVLQQYLESQGLEPYPDGVDDERFASIQAGLNASLPVDYAGFVAASAQPAETSNAWSAIENAFAQVSSATDARLTDIQDAMANEPSLLEGVANAGDPVTMDQILAEYRAAIDEVADERAIISASTMLLFQNAQAGADDLASQARTFAAIQLDTNDSMAGVKAGIQYAAGSFTLGIGLASGNPATAISGLTNVITGGIALVDRFDNSPAPPDPQQLMFDEIADMRNQIEDMRLEMQARFDRIEQQLGIIQLTLRDGFNALGADIADLTADVQQLTRTVYEARASLSRIEDALWGVAQDVLLFDLTLLTNELLDYRDDAQAELPYNALNPNFVSGASDLFSWATSISANDTFAGDQSSTLTVANAAERLGAGSIGRSINDLRELPPSAFGLPRLSASRVVAPAPWAQSASAYAQLARENPWYFAYMYAAQSGQSESEPELDQIIRAGEALAATSAGARDQALFDALFAGYDAGLIQAQTAFDSAIAGMTAAQLVPGVDPWGGLAQELDDPSTYFSQLTGIGGTTTLPLPSSALFDPWAIYGASNAPELCSTFLTARATQLGAASIDETHKISIDANGFLFENDLSIRIRYDINGDTAPSGSNPDLVRMHERRVVVTIENNFGDRIRVNNDGEARELFDEDTLLWLQLAAGLMTGEDMTGQTITAFSQTLGEFFEFTVQQDVNIEPFNGASEFVLERLGELQDLGWIAAADDPGVQHADRDLRGHVALIDAYLTLGMPDLIEQSVVIRAALRANPLLGELSMLVPFDAFFAAQLIATDDAVFADLMAELGRRSAIVKSEVDTAVALPAAGHSYVDWMLAELRTIRDTAFALAVDDTYEQAGAALVVDAASGVLTNDIDQPGRVIEIDTTFTSLPENAPTFGTVSIAPDGSFTYTPGPGFTGRDQFLYRSCATIVAGEDPACSAPAVVVIVGTAPDACSPADIDADGDTDIDDINAFVVAFIAGDLTADIDADGDTDIDDINAFVDTFIAGCR